MFLINIVYVFKFYTILTFQSRSFPMEAQDYQSCVVLLWKNFEFTLKTFK